MELDGLHKELEDRRAEEEKVAQARNSDATRLRSLASALAGKCLCLSLLGIMVSSVEACCYCQVLLVAFLFLPTPKAPMFFRVP